MKSLVKATLISCIVSAPLLAHAQADSSPVTRAEVRADLIRVENAGYRPVSGDASYPTDTQAAEAKVAASEAASTNDVGGASASNANGSPVRAAQADDSIYRGS
ncbi:DUF4148 domain-containing protein [Paraburkholderia sp. NMBU_R16]|uniref:DUF4148 domain-containing protein n=1 Tax=Paraburkholderia sp. NMBU_R16 TaxID=2698676 RepID=UPI00156345A4|nr:DUF4148 domain-containing protein [Paraburkholderia sp. NMBU_R16]NRO99355.1 DUF4148 domain-containing protein [Paraburkholderia sp. NMBU_R16]